MPSDEYVRGLRRAAEIARRCVDEVAGGVDEKEMGPRSASQPACGTCKGTWEVRALVNDTHGRPIGSEMRPCHCVVDPVHSHPVPTPGFDVGQEADAFMAMPEPLEGGLEWNERLCALLRRAVDAGRTAQPALPADGRGGDEALVLPEMSNRAWRRLEHAVSTELGAVRSNPRRWRNPDGDEPSMGDYAAAALAVARRGAAPAGERETVVSMLQRIGDIQCSCPEDAETHDDATCTFVLACFALQALGVSPTCEAPEDEEGDREVGHCDLYEASEIGQRCRGICGVRCFKTLHDGTPNVAAMSLEAQDTGVCGFHYGAQLVACELAASHLGEHGTKDGGK